MAGQIYGGGRPPAAFDPNASAFIPPGGSQTVAAKSGPPRPTHLTVPGASGASANTASVPKPLRTAVPLYTSTVWSSNGIPPPRSAGLPPKPSWVGSSNPPARSGANQPAPNTSSTIPVPGLGLITENNVPENDTRVLVTNSSGGVSSVRYTQTSSYHGPKTAYVQTPQYHTAGNKAMLPPAPQGVLVKSRSDPLPQRPFNMSHGKTYFSSNQSNTLYQSSTASSSSGYNSAKPPSSDYQQSSHSSAYTSSGQSAQQGSESAAGKGPVWLEKHHRHDLRHALKDPWARWEEAFPGALTILTAVNPQQFQMPIGTRVVNIKTDWPENIVKSIRTGRYSVPEKIVGRIMTQWNGRADPSEKVLFLFSVNQGKRFCGLGVLSGPWDKEKNIRGWKAYDNSPCVGSFPVTWIFVKDVPFHLFLHLDQPNTDHRIGNMWNGMHYPDPIGREVVEIYVKTTGFASILGHPKNYKENWNMRRAFNGTFYQKRDESGAYRVQRKGLDDMQGSRQVSYNSQVLPGYVEDYDNDPTPTAGNRVGRLPPLSAAPLAYPPMMGTAYPHRGQLAVAAVHAQGNYNFAAASAGSSHSSNSNAPYSNACAPYQMPAPYQGTGNNATGSFTNPQQLSEGAGAYQNGSQQHAASLITKRSGAKGGPVRPPPISTTFVASRSNNLQAYPIGQAPMSAPMHVSTAQAHRPPPMTAPIVMGDGTAHVQPSPTYLSADGAFALKDTKDGNSIAHLQAYQHRIFAQLRQTEYELSVVASQLGARVLEEKYARLTAEVRHVEHELFQLGAQLSPDHRDSMQYSSQGSLSSSGRNISPVRAADGRPLYSVSMLGSPDTVHMRGAASQGGSFGQSGQASPWAHHRQAIDTIIASPQPGKTPTQRQHKRQSIFFPGGRASEKRPNTSSNSADADADEKSEAGGVRLDQ